MSGIYEYEGPNFAQNVYYGDGIGYSQGNNSNYTDEQKSYVNLMIKMLRDNFAQEIRLEEQELNNVPKSLDKYDKLAKNFHNLSLGMLTATLLIINRNQLTPSNYQKMLTRDFLNDNDKCVKFLNALKNITAKSSSGKINKFKDVDRLIYLKSEFLRYVNYILS